MAKKNPLAYHIKKLHKFLSSKIDDSLHFIKLSKLTLKYCPRVLNLPVISQRAMRRRTELFSKRSLSKSLRAVQSPPWRCVQIRYEDFINLNKMTEDTPWRNKAGIWIKDMCVNVWMVFTEWWRVNLLKQTLLYLEITGNKTICLVHRWSSLERFHSCFSGVGDCQLKVTVFQGFFFKIIVINNNKVEEQHSFVAQKLTVVYHLTKQTFFTENIENWIIIWSILNGGNISESFHSCLKLKLKWDFTFGIMYVFFCC